MRWISVIFAVLSLGLISFGTMSLGASLASAATPVTDGQKCSTAKPQGATWRMAPDSCVYVTSMGGFMRVPRACTELDVWERGRRMTQVGTSFGWPRTEGSPRVSFDRQSRQIVNSGPFTVRLYCWHS